MGDIEPPGPERGAGRAGSRRGRVVLGLLVVASIGAGAWRLWRASGLHGMPVGPSSSAALRGLHRFVIHLSGGPPALAPAGSTGFTAGLAHLDSPAIVEVVTPEGERFEVRSRQSFVKLTGRRVSDVTVEPADGPLPFEDALSLLHAELERLGITPDQQAAATLAAWGANFNRNDAQVRGRAMSTGVPLCATTRLHIQMLPHVEGGWVLSMTFGISQAERERLDREAGALRDGASGEAGG